MLARFLSLFVAILRITYVGYRRPANVTHLRRSVGGRMAKFSYGVLKGTLTGHLRDADDDHYQILVSAGNTMFRIAVNVHSTLTPPDLLFQTTTALPDSLTP